MNRELSIVHILVLLFGSGAWIAINGVFVELPVMVPQLPEGWNLPSLLTILVQVGNIAPITVVLFKVCCNRYYKIKACIYTVITMGTLACLFLAIFWDHTVYIGGSLHSLPLLILFGILCLVDTTSSVTFLPFMVGFQPMFITTYYIGEGMSGLIPSILVLAQGASNGVCSNYTAINSTINETYIVPYTEYQDPRFSVSVFFAMICVLMGMCGLAFYLLNNLKIAKKFYVSTVSVSESYVKANNFIYIDSEEVKGVGLNMENINEQPNTSQAIEEKFEDLLEHQEFLTNCELICLCAIVFWANCMTNGLLPAISSYTSLPYGSVPYHLSASLSAMANPVACFLTFYVDTKSYMVILFVALLGTLCGVYLIILAVQSPCPVLVNSVSGSVLMVLAWIFFIGFLSYVKATIGQIFRERGRKNAPLGYGIIVQLGSLVGALTMFPLHVLKSAEASYTECLRVDAYFLQAYIGRGDVHAIAGNIIKSRSDYQRALKLDPNCSLARVHLGYSLQAEHKLHQAWLQFTHAIEQDPTCQAAYEGRSITCLKAGNTDAAFKDISSALSVGKTTARLHTARGVVFQHMGDLRNAMSDYQHAIKLNKSYATAYFNASVLYLRDRRHTEARAYLDKVIKLSPKDAAAWLNRGIAKVLLRGYKNAEIDFDESIRLNPNNAHVYFNKANLMALLQNYEAADKLYSKAMEINPGDFVVIKKRADIRGKMGRKAEAIIDYRSAIKLRERIRRLKHAARHQ